MNATIAMPTVRSNEIVADNTYPSGMLPHIASQDIAECPVCGSDQKTAFAAGYDYELETCGNRWQFVECIDCHHVWLSPRPSIDMLATIYPPEYYAYNYETAIPLVAKWAKSILDRRKLRDIIRRLDRPVKSYLDIGCGSGRFLDVMASRGVSLASIYGLELDDGVVTRLLNRGYQVWCSRVEDCQDILPSSIDLATLFHVIEHVDNPGRVVKRVADWLTPGGIIAIETPNLDSLDASWFRETWWGGYHIPRHWNLFRPGTLKRLVESVGLDVVALSFLPGHSFWCYSLHHVLKYGNRRWVQLAKCFDPIRSLPSLVAFTAWDMGRAALGAKTSAMLMLAKKR